MDATTAEVSKIVAEVKTILVEDLGLNLEAGEIGDHTSLLEDGLALDSVVIAELIASLEERFAFQFDDENLRAELFEDLTRLAELIAAERRAMVGAQ